MKGLKTMKIRVIALLMTIAMLMPMIVVHAEDDLSTVVPQSEEEISTVVEEPSLAGDEIDIDAELLDEEIDVEESVDMSGLGDLVVSEGEEPAIQATVPTAMFYAVAADGDVTVYADALKAEALGVLAANSVVLVVEKVDDVISHVAFAKDETIVEGYIDQAAVKALTEEERTAYLGNLAVEGTYLFYQDNIDFIVGQAGFEAAAEEAPAEEQPVEEESAEEAPAEEQPVEMEQPVELEQPVEVEQPSEEQPAEEQTLDEEEILGIDGETVQVTEEAAFASGEWRKDSGGWWYRYPDGSYPTSTWLQDGGKWYYINEKGYMVTGWQKLKETNGKEYWFRFNSGDDGYMLTGWQKDGNKYYYLANNGHMLTGWQKLKDTDGKEYWFRFNNGNDGYMLKGWQQDGSKRYYLDNSGHMVTGWQKLVSNGETDWYYFNTGSDGYMLQNTSRAIGSETFTFDSNGRMFEADNGTFVYTIKNNLAGVTVKQYKGSASSVTVPGSYDHITVTEIGEEAFMGNSSLSSINLPDSIQVIGARAFKNCTNLKSMN